MGRRDEVYGADPHLRATCRARGLGYVLAIGCNRTVPTELGDLHVDALTGMVPDHGWFTASAGVGSKGLREYRRAVVTVLPEPDGTDC